MTAARSTGEPELVDLRSDTVTRPDPAMRRAIAEAEVGDDALGDDPTTRRLEETVAALMGKERALFFPSGVMANQTALAVLGSWGGEVVCEAGAHVLNYEEGAAAALSGVQLLPVVTDDGMLTPEHVRDAVRPDSPYSPRSRALTLENTHLHSGGRIMASRSMAAVTEAARALGLPVHLDGARLWHAAAETGEEPEAWARHADTVMVALSKGLGAPVGSVLAGPEDLMEEAWRVRRRLGGAMRQSGLLAAAGLHALEHNRRRLKEDHERARRLAEALGRIEGLSAASPETNIVLVDVVDPDFPVEELLNFLGKHRILMLKFGRSRLRAVTHRDVTSAGMARTITTLDGYRTTGPGGPNVA
ncbi:MAG: GntG family PLP-dependent aldolase [Gemmatimonadota bacterium]